MGSLARLLFGHERAVFTNGQFGFDVRPRVWLLILLAILVGSLSTLFMSGLACG
jgi:hypothetical protein